MNLDGGLRMLTVYLLCGSGQKCIACCRLVLGRAYSSFTTELTVRMLFKSVLIQVVWFIIRSVFQFAIDFVISLYTLSNRQLIAFDTQYRVVSGNNSGYKVHVSSVLLCWRHVCLKSSLKNWPCLQLTCFVRLSHKINPWLVTKENWVNNCLEYSITDPALIHCTATWFS